MLAQHARRTKLRSSAKGATLAEVVDARLGQHGIDAEKISWDAYRRDDGTWRVIARWPSGKATAQAVWELDKARQNVTPHDDMAQYLCAERPAPGSIEAAPAGARPGRPAVRGRPRCGTSRCVRPPTPPAATGPAAGSARPSRRRRPRSTSGRPAPGPLRPDRLRPGRPDRLRPDPLRPDARPDSTRPDGGRCAPTRLRPDARPPRPLRPDTVRPDRLRPGTGRPDAGADGAGAADPTPAGDAGEPARRRGRPEAPAASTRAGRPSRPDPLRPRRAARLAGTAPRRAPRGGRAETAARRRAAAPGPRCGRADRRAGAHDVAVRGRPRRPGRPPSVPSLAVLRPRLKSQPGRPGRGADDKPRKRLPSWDDVLFGGAPPASPPDPRPATSRPWWPERRQTVPIVGYRVRTSSTRSTRTRLGQPAVVRHHDQGARVVGQAGLQLLDRFEVQVVGRLVEHQAVHAARLQQRQRRARPLAR